VKCSVRFKKDPHPNNRQNNDDVNITANIIFNLAHLGISIEDTKSFDINTYFEIVELEMNVITGKQSSKRATQSDIDKFLL
jgi:hypothetical protein